MLVGGFGVFWWMREPAVIEQVVPAPPSEPAAALAQQAARLERLAASLEGQLADVLGGIREPFCPAPAILDAPRRQALLGPSLDDLQRWQALVEEQPPAPATDAHSAPPSTPAAAPSGPRADPEFRSASALSAAALAERLELASAFVLVRNPDEKMGSGTAFFVDDDLLVTNRHVVETAADGVVAVTSTSLGRLGLADIVAMSAVTAPGEPDFALLRLREGRAPGTLPLAAGQNKLASVTSAGYPGFDLENDQGFRELAGGDLAAAPDLHMSRGDVRSIQRFGNTTRIVHTADVLQGYSGGPLVDACGRVIGVNTFIQVDRAQASKQNNALDSGDLAGFLRAHGIAPTFDAGGCE